MEEYYEEQMPDHADVPGDQVAEQDEQDEQDEQEMPDIMTMGDLLGSAETPLFTQPKRGQVVEGVIVQIDPGAILVDIGAKLDGFIHPNEVDKIQQDPDIIPQVGDRILVYVVQPANKDGHPVLSLSRAQAERDWREAQQRFEANEILDLQVMGYNKGGLIVRLGEVRGFIPASQLERRIPSSNRAEDRMKQLSKLVGQDIKLKIVELDRTSNRLILSERLAMREWREQQRDSLMDNLREGEVRQGRVSGLSDFGAFVDIGGADGLVHLSELSWDQVAHPRNVVQVGDQVDVYVLNVDRDRRRIALSIKRTKPEPWGDIHQRYQIGQIISGQVTKLASFGAFVRLEEGIEGLAHISELSAQRIQHPKEAVQEGEKYDFRIIRIDSARRRMRLSLKQLVEEETPDLDAEDIPTPEPLVKGRRRRRRPAPAQDLSELVQPEEPAAELAEWQERLRDFQFEQPTDEPDEIGEIEPEIEANVVAVATIEEAPGAVVVVTEEPKAVIEVPDAAPAAED